MGTLLPANRECCNAGDGGPLVWRKKAAIVTRKRDASGSVSGRYEIRDLGRGSHTPAAVRRMGRRIGGHRWAAQRLAHGPSNILLTAFSVLVFGATQASPLRATAKTRAGRATREQRHDCKCHQNQQQHLSDTISVLSTHARKS